MSNRTNNSTRNIFFGLFAKCITIVLPFIVRTLIIRRLGIEYGGLNSLFSSILSFLSLTELGVGSTLVYLMYKPAAENDEIRMSAILNLYKRIYKIIGIVILSIGLILLPFLNHFITGDVPENINIYFLFMIYLINISLSYFLFGYRSSLFVAYQRTDIQSKVMLIAYSLTGILQIASILFLNSYYCYALCNIVFTVMQNLSIYILARKIFPNIKCEGNVSSLEIREVFKKTFALAGHKIGGTIVGSLDNIVISSLLGLTMVGIYGNYYTILLALMGFIGVYNNALLPSIGNFVICENKNRIYRLFLDLNFMHIWIVGEFSVCFLVLVPDFIKLWVGEQFAFSLIETILVTLYFYSWQFRVLLCNFKDAAGLWTEDALKPYVASLVNVVLNIFLVKKIGISGALISTIICMIFIFFPWEMHVLFKHLLEKSTKEFIMKEFKWFALWCTISGIMYFICSKISINSLIMSLLIKVVICAVIPNIIFFVFNNKTNEMNFVYEKLRRVVNDKHFKKT